MKICCNLPERGEREERDGDTKSNPEESDEVQDVQGEPVSDPEREELKQESDEVQEDLQQL